ncbi:MAG: hypothetical protein RIS94_473 [Pseudomonadota bacterium]|jgi:hypothetical protein
MQIIRAALILALATGLPGCSRDTDPGPGGVTQGEARALDDAAQMLEQRPAPPLVDATVPADLTQAPQASGAPEN